MVKILVIEDEEPIRESIVEALKTSDYDVIDAEDGLIGIGLAQKYKPDLILCDVMMPNLDGYSVLKQLRQNKDTSMIPLIFLTARSEKSDLRQGMNLGADDYLVKPVSRLDLLTAISARMQKQALLQQGFNSRLENLRRSISMSLPHELREPLTRIVSFSGMLVDEYSLMEGYEIFEVAEDIHSAAERLHRLVQNCLVYAELQITALSSERLQTLQSSKMTFPKELIAHTCTEVAHRCDREIDLELDLQDTIAILQISKVSLKKIVTELLDNAFKFSEPGTSVKVASAVQESNYVIYIIDLGIGMTSEQIEGLGAYIQFDRQIYEQQGTGLGLVIAKQLLELHGGEFSIESIPSKQTTLRLAIPIVSSND